MDTIPDPPQDHLDDRFAEAGDPQSASPRSRSQLPHILGIGGGAISSVIVAITFHDVFPIGVFLAVPFGAVIGGLVRHVGIFAGLGLIVGFIVLSVAPPEHEDRAFFVLRDSIAVGSLFGVVLSLFLLRRRVNPFPADASKARGDRLQLGRTCLWLGPLLGAIFGALIGGPILIGAIFFGVVIGVALFFALTLSGFR